MEKRSFVCGLYGARDSYQIPLALEEDGRLELLLTDFYGPGSALAKFGIPRAKQPDSGLPEEKVRGSLWASVLKKVAGTIIRDLELRNHIPDRVLARRIAKYARRCDAHAITYEPYAVKRPAGGFTGGRKQIVFYYHPHVDTEDAIYRRDRESFPDFYAGYPVTSSPWRRRTADAWKHADLVLCASSFTRRTLMSAGMPADKCRVVPYGGGPAKAFEMGGQRPPISERNGALRLLFVGRGPMRKGLHHLLLAWKQARRHVDDRLTIVCQADFPALRACAADQKSVTWRDWAASEELHGLYAQSDALVVPSLCEGFGYVYLEAMEYGCAVVGTSNSALPDIGGRDEGVFTVEAGEVGALAELISSASADPSMFRRSSRAAAERSATFTWEKFRKGIVEATAGIG